MAGVINDAQNLWEDNDIGQCNAKTELLSVLSDLFCLCNGAIVE